MVFNVAGEVNQPDQASVVKGKQRKHSGQKRKGALTNIGLKSKDSIPSPTGTKNSGLGTPENDMGNTSTQSSVNNAPLRVAEKEVEDDVAECGNVTYGCNSKQNTEYAEGKKHLTNNGGNRDVLMPTLEKTATADNPDGKMVGVSKIYDPESEVARLKQLLLLQVSLISRQQDLLRLRDRTIMQWKASNANCKCHLSRVRRRMSKRKSDGMDESPKASKRKSSERPTENVVSGDPGISTPINVYDTSTLTVGSTDTVKPIELEQKSTNRCLDFTQGDLKTATSTQSTPSITAAQKFQDFSETPALSTRRNDKSSVSVPIEFNEEKQADVVHAMMISPPDKALKSFCDITSSSPPLDEFAFKICDRCQHCVAIAQEIARLLRTVKNLQSPENMQPHNLKPSDREMIDMVGVVLPNTESAESGIKFGGKNSIMRTSVSYHRTSPTFDQNHWWWDLKCGSIRTEKALKIPTWREQEILPLPVESHQEVTEATDDQAYTRRHSKLELDEKRRKKWDIQRIREYRYNEKLRQKLLKQGAVYDSPVIESFAGHLHDAESVEVQETLPVNVFGYPVPHMDPEEFDLAASQELLKNIATTAGRKKLKRT